jgi:hypothetical protein
MTRRRPMILVLPASALVVLAAWLLAGGRAPAAPSAPAAAPDAPSTEAPRGHVDADQLRRVQDTVAQKNREATKDRDAFLKAGWQMVSTAPPDHRVVGYDPKLLKEGREHDLKMQLLSTVPSPQQVGNVAEIARRAKDGATRYAAVEALGHLNAPEATSALYDLMVNGGLDASDEARGQIAGLLRPTALDDPMAAKIAMLLDSPTLTDVEKQEIAFTLALLGLRDGMNVDSSVPLSADARALIAHATTLAQSRFVKALDRQGGNP